MDTGANHTYIIYRGQYDAYCSTFGTYPTVKPNVRKTIKGIDGNHTGYGVVNKQIPLRVHGLLMEENILAIDAEIPTLLSPREMLNNNPEVSIEENVLNIMAGKNRKIEELLAYLQLRTKGNES